MKEAIGQRARELGFDDCRFTTADPPASGPQFKRWLAQRCHGDMGYLERNAPKRLSPQHVLPGAKTILMLAVSYSGDRSQESEARSAGLVARYARYSDYHHVIGEHLQQLTQFVNQLGGVSTRSLWYVDTGPLLERDLAPGLASSANTPTSLAASLATGFSFRKSSPPLSSSRTNLKGTIAASALAALLRARLAPSQPPFDSMPDFASPI